MTLRLLIAVGLLALSIVLMALGPTEVSHGGHTKPTKVNLRRHAAVAFLASLLFLGLACIRVVDAGHAGVPVTFGTIGSDLRAGIAVTNPLATVHQLSIRTEEYTMSISANEGAQQGDDSVEVKGRDGATGYVDATILYRLDPAEAGSVYRSLGTNYIQKLIRPSSRTCIRDAYASVPMVEAATTARAGVADAITTCIRARIEPRGFVLEDFQLRNVKVDEAVQKAIDLKVAAQQEAQRKIFELEATATEAEKRRIEAKGIADAEQIIRCGAVIVEKERDGTTIEVAEAKSGESCEERLTPAYLQYQYIQALRELVDAPNNSTIVIPFDSNLTPLLNLPTTPPSD